MSSSHVCKCMGGDVRYRTRITGFRKHCNRVVALATDTGDELPVDRDGGARQRTEAVDMARALGMRLPIYPVKGYSVTLPVMQCIAYAVGKRHRHAAQDGLRAAAGHAAHRGHGRIGGHDTRTDPARIADLIEGARETFPGSCDFATPTPSPGPACGPRRRHPCRSSARRPTTTCCCTWATAALWLHAGDGQWHACWSGASRARRTTPIAAPFAYAA